MAELRTIILSFRVDDLENWEIQTASEHLDIPTGRFMRAAVMEATVKALDEAVKALAEGNA